MALRRRRVPSFADPLDADGVTIEAVVVQDDVNGWLQAAESRTQSAPNIYDLLGLLDQLKKSDPVRARSVERDLRWLMNKAKRLGIQWDSPWR